MLYFSRGSQPIAWMLPPFGRDSRRALDKLGPRKRVLAVPPDATRLHSFAGDLTRYAWQYYGDRLVDILPALGTHTPMTDEQIGRMFGDVPSGLFREHDWRQRHSYRWGRAGRVCAGGLGGRGRLRLAGPGGRRSSPTAGTT